MNIDHLLFFLVSCFMLIYNSTINYSIIRHFIIHHHRILLCELSGGNPFLFGLLASLLLLDQHLFLECFQYLLDIFGYLLNIWWIFVQYLFNICWIFVEYLLNICWIFAEYFLNICWIFLEYLLDICWLFVGSATFNNLNDIWLDSITYQYLSVMYAFFTFFLYTMALYNSYLIPPDPVLVVGRKAGERLVWGFDLFRFGRRHPQRCRHRQRRHRQRDRGNRWAACSRAFSFDRCICLKLQTVFVSNCKLYLSQIANCICLKLKTVFVSNYKMYWSQIAKCIFSNCNFLSQIARCICLKS